MAARAVANMTVVKGRRRPDRWAFYVRFKLPYLARGSRCS